MIDGARTQKSATLATLIFSLFSFDAMAASCSRSNKLLEASAQIVAETLSVQAEDVRKSRNIFEEFGLDSLDTVELMMALENEFDVEISGEQMERCVDLRDVEVMISELICDPETDQSR